MINKTLLFSLFCSLSWAANAKNYELYFLGGQSNMAGYGDVKKLPNEYSKPFEQVRIFQGNPQVDFKKGGGEGIWAALQPGMGHTFKSSKKNNQWSEDFGPELSFGHAIAQMRPEKNIAIVKYALGGTALGYGVGNNWFPDYRRGNGINQYDHFMNTLFNALNVQDIDGDGELDTFTPKGIVWMQGESDAYDSLTVANNYQRNLTKMMALIRAALRSPDLPVVIGKITDSKMDPEDGLRMDYGSIVQAAQANFVANDTCADLVKITEKFTHLEDGWHYHSSDYIRLGEAFAKSVNQLNKQCSTK